MGYWAQRIRATIIAQQSAVLNWWNTAWAGILGISPIQPVPAANIHIGTPGDLNTRAIAIIPRGERIEGDHVERQLITMTIVYVTGLTQYTSDTGYSDLVVGSVVLAALASLIQVVPDTYLLADWPAGVARPTVHRLIRTEDPDAGLRAMIAPLGVQTVLTVELTITNPFLR